MAKAGAVRELRIGGEQFEVSSDADITCILPGYSIEVDSSQTFGEKVIQTAVIGKVTGIKLDCTSQQEAKLLEFWDTGKKTQFYIVMADGAIYEGNLYFNGDRTGRSSLNGTVEFEMSGADLRRVKFGDDS